MADWNKLITERWDCGAVELFGRRSAGAPGERRALLLLHGFPQMHAMWRRVVERLPDDMWLLIPDLRGYGDSTAPPATPDHAAMSKRAMADDMVALLDRFGIGQVAVCGHDRGARVAHRLALDHPQRVASLGLIDIAPTLDMYECRDPGFARAYEHWFSLIQPAPLPEKMVAGAGLDYLHAKLGGWGSGGLAHLEAADLAEYERCFARPAVIHAMCEDYRASAGIDLEHDRASRAQRQRIACPTAVLVGGNGVVRRFFDTEALWNACAERPVRFDVADGCGHYIPEQAPGLTAEWILACLADGRTSARQPA